MEKQMTEENKKVMNVDICIVTGKSSRSRYHNIDVTPYEVRVFDADRVGAPHYFRQRKDGYNPVTLARRTSGTGCPKWMHTICMNKDAFFQGVSWILTGNAKTSSPLQ